MSGDVAESSVDGSDAGDGPEPSNAPAAQGWGRLLILGGVLAVVALIGAMVLIVIGTAILDKPRESTAARLHDIEVETGISTANVDTTHPPQYDISLGTCEVRGRGVRAAGTLTNATDAPADYRIWLSFRESGPGTTGGEFAASEVVVQNVPEHSTTNWEALVSDRPDGAFACRVLRIDRSRSTTDGGS